MQMTRMIIVYPFESNCKVQVDLYLWKIIAQGHAVIYSENSSSGLESICMSERETVCVCERERESVRER